MHRFVRMIICGLVAVGVTACIHTATRSAASCLHPVAPGDSVDMRDAQHPCIVHANGDPPTCFQPCTDPSSCAMPPGGGEHRMEFASAIVSNLGALSATFPVPPPPPASPGAAPLIYFFPAAQTDGGSTILQPVLQYGNNDTFGGNGWQIASWYLDCNGQSFHSQPMNVNAGDTITASMISTCSGDLCTWTIAAAASDAKTKATVQSVLELRNVRSTLLQSGTIIAAALETYGIDACSQYPGGGKTVFSAIDIEGVPLLTWKSVSIPQNRPCGENVVRNDDHTITLTY